MLEQALTVQQFEDLLFERYPQINNKKFQVAVNEEFVQNRISFNLMILLH
ncbi:MoaD/ThiS family protein [Staphylococcus aureus]